MTSNQPAHSPRTMTTAEWRALHDDHRPKGFWIDHSVEDIGHPDGAIRRLRCACGATHLTDVDIDRVEAPTPGPWHTAGVANPGTPNARVSLWGPRPANLQSGIRVASDLTPKDAERILSGEVALRLLSAVNAAIARGKLCPICDLTPHEAGCPLTPPTLAEIRQRLSRAGHHNDTGDVVRPA